LTAPGIDRDIVSTSRALATDDHSVLRRRGCQPRARTIAFFRSDIDRIQGVVVRRSFLTIGATIAATVFLVPMTTAGATISQAKLSGELLTTRQIPAGWTQSISTSEGVGCVHDLLEPKGVKQTRSAQVYFLGTVDNLPRFDEKIATYSNTKSAYTKVIATIKACHTLTGLYDGLQISGSVAPMSFAHYGNASAAYAMTVSDARGTLHYDYLIVRKGSVLAAFLEGSYPEVIASEFQSLVATGVKRLT
jgi:hypothetical protein